MTGKRTQVAPVVRWRQEEIEAVCKRVAELHIRTVAALSDKMVHNAACEEGYGYRPKRKAAFFLGTARKFLNEHTQLIETYIKEFREGGMRNAAEQPLPSNVRPLQLVQTPALQEEPSRPEPTPLEMIAKGVQGLLGAAFGELLKAHEESVIQSVTDLLKGIPGYNRPYIAKAPEPVQQAKVRKVQVLVVNALPAQFQSVQRAYPDLDLRLIEGRIPGEDDPDLVISLTKFMNHPLDRSLRKKYGEKYCPVNGAADSVKLAIQQRLHVGPHTPAALNGLH